MLNKACKPTLATQFDTSHKNGCYVRFFTKNMDEDFYCTNKSYVILMELHYSTDILFITSCK